mmetsp:Transcript_57939/g.163599  ORF Transcript_57939/g.163599 Transcript_57939/m.163599 type:complete len:230 (+) Transcript_57939:196-885(+)
MPFWHLVLMPFWHVVLMPLWHVVSSVPSLAQQGQCQCNVQGDAVQNRLRGGDGGLLAEAQVSAIGVPRAVEVPVRVDGAAVEVAVPEGAHLHQLLVVLAEDEVAGVVDAARAVLRYLPREGAVEGRVLAADPVDGLADLPVEGIPVHYARLPLRSQPGGPVGLLRNGLDNIREGPVLVSQREDHEAKAVPHSTPEVLHDALVEGRQPVQAVERLHLPAYQVVPGVVEWD